VLALALPGQGIAATINVTNQLDEQAGANGLLAARGDPRRQ
jgi:hypothetical protein